MTEIPETVYAQARAIVNDTKDPVNVSHLVALGIVAERERCVRIARIAVVPGGNPLISTTANLIAEAIANGDAP